MLIQPHNWPVRQVDFFLVTTAVRTFTSEVLTNPSCPNAMRIPFKIFPSVGYKNSQFQAVTTIPGITIKIEYQGTQQITLNLSPEQPATLLERSEPGEYRAYTTHNGQLYEQHFQVLDAIRIGSSELKQTYVFDELPYAFFLMRDRMLIHQEATGHVVEESLSPSAIIQLDATTLLFQTELGTDPVTGLEITNLGIYSLDSFSIVAQLLDHYSLIWLDGPRNRIWLYSLAEHQIICLSTQATDFVYWQELLSVPTDANWKLQPGNAQLFARSTDTDTDTIIIIATDKLQVTTILQRPDLAIDETGICYSLAGRVIYLDELAPKTQDKPLFEVPATAALHLREFYFVGTSFNLSAGLTDFDRCLAEVTASLLPVAAHERKRVVLPAPLPCATEVTTCTILPAPNGLYVLQTSQQQTIDAIDCYRPQERLPTNFTAVASNVPIHQLDYYQEEARPTTLLPSSPSIITILGRRQKALTVSQQGIVFLMQGSQREVLNCKPDQYQFISTDTDQHYLMARHANAIDLYSLVQPLRKALVNAELVDSKRAQTGSVLWYYTASGQPAGYFLDANSNGLFTSNTPRQALLTEALSIQLSPTYAIIGSIQTGDTSTLVNALVTSSGTVCASVPGEIIAVSTNLTKVVSRRASELHVYTYQLAEANYVSQLVPLPLLAYQESYLSPDGEFLVLKDKAQHYHLYNIATGKSSTFFSGKFLAFDKSGSLIVERGTARAACLLDPVTFEDITPLSYHHYRFLSPDGKLFAQTSVQKKIYAGYVNNYINESNVRWLEQTLDYANGLERTTENIQRVQQTRIKFYTENAAYFATQGITDANSLRSGHTYQRQTKLEIGIVGTATSVEVNLPSNTEHFNYAAFSFNNEWIAIVGKAPGCGFITLVKLAFDPVAQTLTITEYFDSDYPDKAAWVCGISKTDQFATWDSSGDTYILELDNDLPDPQLTTNEINGKRFRHPGTVLTSSGAWKLIEGKNFLCYSPSGRFMALSEQWYDPIICNGTGHQDSNAVHVISTSDFNLVDSFYRHGAPVRQDRGSKQTFAAFSEDEQSLMTMSTDGVVIVRRIADKLSPHS